MSRPLRIQLPGLNYHVHARGNGRMDIFLDDGDRRKFLELVDGAVGKFRLLCHAFCMMTNHYHLVITTTEANLSDAMHDLDGQYGQWWNRRHNRVGHMFQGRFGAKVVQDDVYLLTVCKYVVRNPVRKKLVKSVDQWPWSSYRASAGLAPVPPFLHPETLWRLLGGDADPATSAARYRKYVAMAEDEAEKLMSAPIIGDPEFVQRFEKFRAGASREVPLRERQLRPALERLFAGAVTRPERNARAVTARAEGYSIREISSYLGLDRTTVSKMIAATPGSGVNKPTVSDLTPEA